MNQPSQVVIIGGSGGLGLAIVKATIDKYPQVSVIATYYQTIPNYQDKRVTWYPLDITQDEQIEHFSTQFNQVDWLINCVGILYDKDNKPEKSITKIDSEFFMKNVQINTLPTLLLAKYFDKLFKQSSSPVFSTISARVGSIDDNRLGGWYSYRSSKSALNMVLKNLSIEWSHRHPKGCVLSLHPGTNDTSLSKPYQKNVIEGKLFNPDDTAINFLNIFDCCKPSDSGKFLAWDGSSIQW